ITAYLGVQAAGDMPSQYWFPGLLIVAALWLVWRAVQRRNVSRSNRMMNDGRRESDHTGQPVVLTPALGDCRPTMCSIRRCSRYQTARLTDLTDRAIASPASRTRLPLQPRL